MTVAIERVLEGAHYPSDVVAGAAFGILAARLALVLCDGWFGPDWRRGRRRRLIDPRPATTDEKDLECKRS